MGKRRVLTGKWKWLDRLGLAWPVLELAATWMWIRKQRQSRVNWPHLYLNWGWVAWEKRMWYSDFIENSVLLSERRFAFFGTMGSRWRMRLPLGRPKVFVTQEDTRTRFTQYNDYAKGSVALSLGFKSDSGSWRYHFPIWMEWFLMPTVKFDEQPPRNGDLWSPQGFVEEIERWDGTDDRVRFAGLIASHDDRGNGKGLRTKMVELLGAVGRVDCAGRLLNNTDTLKREFGDRAIDFLQTCRFNVCFENVSAQDYVTEKLFQAMLAGCIPVYWGDSAIPEPDFLTGNGVVFFNPRDPEIAIQQIERLATDPNYRREWMARPKFHSDAAKKLENRLLGLEAHLDRISA